MQNINKNIKFLRKEKKLTQEAFAKELGIKRSLLGAYEEGRAKPNLSTQLTITKIFGISLDRLIKEDLSRSGALPNQDLPLAEQDMQAGETRVLAITVDSEDNENIELVHEKARAGYLNSYADPEFVAELPRFKLPFLPAGTYRGFEITGDSMLPVQPGSIIIGEYVSEWEQLTDGQTYILLTKQDGIVYKRVFNQIADQGQFILQSDNPSYPPYNIPVNETLEIWEAKLCIGKVSRQQDSSVENMMGMLAKLQREMQEIKRSKPN